MSEQLTIGALGFVTPGELETLAVAIEKSYGDFAANLINLDELRRCKVANIGGQAHGVLTAATLLRLYLASDGIEEVSQELRERCADSFLWLSCGSAAAVADARSGKPKPLRGAAAAFVKHCHEAQGTALRSRLRSNKAKRYFQAMIDARSVKEGMLDILKAFFAKIWP